MGALSKAKLYFDTARHLRVSQIVWRLWRHMGGSSPLRRGAIAHPEVSKADIRRIPMLPELDFDEAFLARFDCDAVLEGRLELLHHEESVDWASSWHEPLSTPLWRFNLHYCEYILPLACKHLGSGDTRYLEKAKSIVHAWIRHNPLERGGDGWHPYTISMRVVNWIAFYGEERGLWIVIRRLSKR